jgi:predicted RND superfamily exporter protein
MHLTNLSQNIILKGKELFIFQLNEIGFPITITSFTTAIGFLSFISSDLVPISRLGVISSLVILCLHKENLKMLSKKLFQIKHLLYLLKHNRDFGKKNIK